MKTIDQNLPRPAIHSKRIVRRAVTLQGRAMDRAIGRAYDAWGSIDYASQLDAKGDAIGDLIQILNDAGVALAKLEAKVNSRFFK